MTTHGAQRIRVDYNKKRTKYMNANMACPKQEPCKVIRGVTGSPGKAGRIALLHGSAAIFCRTPFFETIARAARAFSFKPSRTSRGMTAELGARNRALHDVLRVLDLIRMSLR